MFKLSLKIILFFLIICILIFIVFQYNNDEKNTHEINKYYENFINGKLSNKEVINWVNKLNINEYNEKQLIEEKLLNSLEKINWLKVKKINDFNDGSRNYRGYLSDKLWLLTIVISEKGLLFVENKLMDKKIIQSHDLYISFCTIYDSIIEEFTFQQILKSKYKISNQYKKYLFAENTELRLENKNLLLMNLFVLSLNVDELTNLFQKYYNTKLKNRIILLFKRIIKFHYKITKNDRAIIDTKQFLKKENRKFKDKNITEIINLNIDDLKDY